MQSKKRPLVNLPQRGRGTAKRWMRRASYGKTMAYKYNEKLVANAQELRKNMTDEEKQLWYQFLKRLPVTVNRQKNIGNYIVDFFISSKNIVIEIDGVQHQTEQMLERDKERDLELRILGIKVLRYKNSDVNKNFNAVCNEILKALELDVESIHDF